MISTASHAVYRTGSDRSGGWLVYTVSGSTGKQGQWHPNEQQKPGGKAGGQDPLCSVTGTHVSLNTKPLRRPTLHTRKGLGGTVLRRVQVGR
jgi:hypothetical protein